MKWLIVEDALRDRKGHWLEYVSTFVRGLRVLGDEVEVLCDRRAEGFVLERTGARPVLPESIWHRMGDGAGALKRYLRVPMHAVATFFAMRKVLKKFSQVKTNSGELMAYSSRGAKALDTRRSIASAAPATLTSEATFGRLPRATPCAGGLDSSPASPDWIFVPTVLVHHLLGWWMLLKSGVVPRSSRMLLFFPNLPIGLDSRGEPFWNSSPTTRLMAWLFAKMRDEVEGGKAILGVETHAMRRALEGLIRMPVVYLPHPVEFPGEARRRGDFLTTNHTELHERGRQGDAQGTCAGAAFSNPHTCGLARDSENTSITRSASGTPPLPAISNPLPATSASPIVFGCYGAARWEKGSDIFQQAVNLILKNQVGTTKNKTEPETCDQLPAHPARPTLRFAIQWVEDFRDDAGNLISIDPGLREHPQVEVIGRYFEGDEYERQLAQTDVMVLPYRSPYRLRVSRVVIEAMLKGLPVVVTRGTTLFEQAEEYGEVVGCEEGNPASLAKGMLKVIEEFETIRSSAKGKVKAASQGFSIEFFRNVLKSQLIQF